MKNTLLIGFLFFTLILSGCSTLPESNSYSSTTESENPAFFSK